MARIYSVIRNDPACTRQGIVISSTKIGENRICRHGESIFLFLGEDFVIFNVGVACRQDLFNGSIMHYSVFGVDERSNDLVDGIEDKKRSKTPRVKVVHRFLPQGRYADFICRLTRDAPLRKHATLHSHRPSSLCKAVSSVKSTNPPFGGF